MGIRGLSQLVTNLKNRKKVPLRSLGAERNKRWAVDALLFLHRSRGMCATHINESEFGMTHRRPHRFRNVLSDVPLEHSHLVGLADTICQLLSAGITPVLIFDGAPPPEKLATIHRRRVEKIRHQRKIEWVEMYVIQKLPIPVRFGGPGPPAIRTVQTGRSYADALATTAAEEQQRQSTAPTTTTTNTEGNMWYANEHEYLPPTPEEIAEIQTNLVRHKRDVHASYITPEHVYQAQGLCEILGIPYILAEGEADVTAVALQKRGIVDAVYTADSDAMVYGAATTVRKIVNYDLMDCIELDFVLQELDVTYEQFVRFCVLVGCDFCESAGPMTTYRVLQLVRDPAHQGPHLFDTFRNTHGTQWVERAKRAFEIYTHTTDVSYDSVDILPCRTNHTRESLTQQLKQHLGLEGNYVQRVVDQIVRAFADFTSG